MAIHIAAQHFNDEEDINWLFDVHLKNNSDLKDKTKSFILCGDESNPSLIELYSTKEVYIGQLPIFVKKGE